MVTVSAGETGTPKKSLFCPASFTPKPEATPSCGGGGPGSSCSDARGSSDSCGPDECG